MAAATASEAPCGRQQERDGDPATAGRVRPTRGRGGTGPTLANPAIAQDHVFCLPPLYAPLVVPNATSDARDHCASERTLLSWVRLSMYLSVVSCAVLVSFQLRARATGPSDPAGPTDLEARVARPLGIVFWLLAVSALANGFANYVSTLAKYSRGSEEVHSGVWTQVLYGIMSGVIVATCIILLVGGGG
ncbi:hypothetical protein KEM52_005089 [Ascosphaera acerosa]|nr:hypothetical protein KEM52_005089 [Ascosphaera acerosa]